MRLTTHGQRHTLPAYFDMACRCRPRGARWYGKGFRIGDRAAAYVCMLDWRHRNPTRKLTVLENVWLPGACYGLNAELICPEMADEIWYAVTSQDPLSKPLGEPLYDRSLWLIWRELRRRWQELPRPGFKPRSGATGNTAFYLKQKQVPPFYVTVQPLIDATYNKYRNAPLEWWQQLCKALSERGIPLIVVDRQGGPFDLVRTQYSDSWNISQSDVQDHLALIKGAAVHIGAETGMTLWAAIVGTPVVAAYKFWGIMNHMDTRPIPFGAPVVHADIKGPPEAVAAKAEALMSSKAVRA